MSGTELFVCLVVLAGAAATGYSLWQIFKGWPDGNR